MTTAPEATGASTGHGPTSITTWTRLEPQVAAADLTDSAAARVEDPAWLLCRQWQLGEFRAEDSGTPVDARLRVRTGGFHSYRGAGTWPLPDGYPPAVPFAAVPLETMVEREPEGDLDLGLRADGGRQFLRALTAAGVGQYGPAFAARYPLPTAQAGPAVDPATVDRLRLLAGRVPDVRALLAAFGSGPTLPAQPVVAPEHRAAVLAVAADLATRWAHLVSRPGEEATAWAPDRAEHHFAIGGHLGEPMILKVGEHTGGALDWPDFDAGGDEYNVDYGDEAPQTVHTAMPAPLTYPGMPSDRWWEFEDHTVSFAGAEAGAADLGRLLMLEFATLYSNDWFIIPVELPVATATTVESLVVTDTFGVRTLVDPAQDAEWDLYRYGHSRSLLPPVLADSLEGPPVEDVLLVRDESSNMAWAVEQKVESPLGKPVDRLERHLAALREEPESPAADADLVYRLRTDIPPEHWIPFLPEPSADGLRLRRTALRPPGGSPIPPAGHLLAATTRLFAEEVPREGARVTRVWQRARWSDGSTHLWLSRKKTPGRGEVSTNLHHDITTRRAEARPAE